MVSPRARDADADQITYHPQVCGLECFAALCHQRLVLCEVQQLAKQCPAGGFALQTLWRHAISVEHKRAVFVIYALSTLLQSLRHLGHSNNQPHMLLNPW